MSVLAVLAQTGAEGVDTMTFVGGGLLLAGVAVLVYRVISRRKSKDDSAE